MSGGSYDYAFARVDDMASSIRSRHTDPLHIAFAAHLDLVAVAMKAVEWVDSSDLGPGDDVEAIRAVLAPGAELGVAIEVAEKARASLDEAIALAKVQL